MNLKQAEDVVYVYDEIKWLNNTIEKLLDTGVHTTEELRYRKRAVEELRRILAIRVNQLEEM